MKMIIVVLKPMFDKIVKVPNLNLNPPTVMQLTHHAKKLKLIF